MAEHKKEDGLSKIKFIADLGKALGYRTAKEFPVKQSNSGHSSAVDIAWFIDEEEAFPLFIFEVESRATNSMSANPMKVFSQSTADFEKPLFLFQLILKGGGNSGRVEILQDEYGKMNYRIYSGNQRDFLQFLMDIISQHRRLSNKIEVYRFLSVIIEFNISDQDLVAICEHIESKNFTPSIDSFLPAYGKLFLKYDRSLKNYLRYLKAHLYKEITNSIANYETYLGSWWSYPIHLSLLAFNEANLTEKMKMFQKFYDWQENGSHLSKIGPHFGLSMDYDQFIIWMSGQLIALISIMFKELDDALKYLIGILIEITKRTKPPYNLPNLIWANYINEFLLKDKKISIEISEQIDSMNIEPLVLKILPPNFIDDIEWIESVSQSERIDFSVLKHIDDLNYADESLETNRLVLSLICIQMADGIGNFDVLRLLKQAAQSGI